ncbi:MAG: hypothetical protein MJY89_06080 [Bacteroidales bacterium]|nr:hypothetical protein [Bacteroidales bacterium]
MADELKENVTTPWMQNELTAEEINRDDNAGENTGFWILRGKGSGRDRFINLKNLRVWIQAAVDAVAYIKDNGISGIKKALAFVDENSMCTLNLSVRGVTFTQNIETCSISMDENELHFEGNSVFNNSVKFLSDALFEAGVRFQEGGPSIFVNDEGIISFLNQDGSYAPFRASSLTLSGYLKANTLNVGGLHILADNGNYDDDFTFRQGLTVQGNQKCQGNLTIGGGVVAYKGVSSHESLNAGTVVTSKIYDATEKSDIENPETLLYSARLIGATALVRNNTGAQYEISRQGYGSNRMYLVVEPGEVLRYVYDGSKWVHSW